MIITRKVKEVQRSNVETGKKYGISDSSMVSYVLSNNIYTFTRRQEAVIRELSTNAQDSHTEAGKEFEPIHVHLPSLAEPYLIIEDTGIGLLANQVEDLAFNYFKSLSGQRKKANGIFGLGMKSPFSYSSMFTIEAVKDGQHCIYQCYKDEKDEPNGTQILSGTTDRPNGVIITVPVEMADIKDFEKAAIMLYQHTASIPKFTGNDITDKILALRTSLEGRVRHRGKGWKYIPGPEYGAEDSAFDSAFNHANRNSLVMGGVSYPLDFKVMAESNYHGLKDVDLSRISGLVLEMDVGKTPVNIDTGREKLQYTEVTCRAIEKRMREIIAFAKKSLSAICKNKSQWAVMEYINEHMMGDRLMELGLTIRQCSHFCITDLSFNGLEIKLLTHDPKTMRIVTSKFDTRNKRNTRKKTFDKITPRSTTHVVLKTSNKINREVIGDYMYAKQCSVLIIEGERGRPTSIEATRQLFREMGNPNFITEDTLTQLTEDARSQHKKMIAQAKAIPFLEKIQQIQLRANCCTTTKKIPVELLYEKLNVATKKKAPVYFYKKVTKRSTEMPSDILVHLADKLGYLPDGKEEEFTNFLMIDEKTLELLEGFTCLVDLGEVLINISQNKNHPQHKEFVRLLTMQIMANESQLINTYGLISLKKMIDSVGGMFPEQSWKFNAVKRLISFNNRVSKNNRYMYMNTHDSYWIKLPIAVNAAKQTIKKLGSHASHAHEFFQAYPMLVHFNFDGKASREERNSMIKDYVVMVDSQKNLLEQKNLKVTKAA